MQKLDIQIDVTEAAGLGEKAHIALTVHLPDTDHLPSETVVCFAKPGGGYSRGYYTVDLPGPAKGAQAEWHTQRGWIFVSVDHLGVGESSVHDAAKLDYTTVAAGNHAAEQEVLKRLKEGTIVEGYPRISSPLKIGIGQSMGGCMTIIQQGRYHCYDGIGVLGYSAVHTMPVVKPGGVQFQVPWMPRDTLLKEPRVVLNTQAVAKSMAALMAAPPTNNAMGWCFHYDDVAPELVAKDLEVFAQGGPASKPGYRPNPWNSVTRPGAVAQSCLTPGIVAPEAAAIVSPVLVAMGERDVILDPRGELRAFKSSDSVDFYVCPHMGHMHNFASTRVLFWRRIETWVEWVREMKTSSPS